MGVEIERKFLVLDWSWRQDQPGVVYRQGYIPCEGLCTVRVRLAGGLGYLTIKGPARGLVRSEFEYSIPADDARQLFDSFCHAGRIEKTRYRIPFAGHVWEVDVFAGDNEGLVLAEIELPAADCPFALPPWAGPEVTHDSRYTNASLARFPLSRWPEGERPAPPA